MKKFAIAAILASLSAGAFAAQGDIIARFRVINVNPDVSTSNGAAAGAGLGLTQLKTDVKDATVPELDFTYMLTDNIGAELILGTSRHEVTANGTSLGKVFVLPPTLTAQYHFSPEATFRPYVGAGINYTRFYDAGLEASGVSKLSVKKNSWGPALQIGADYAISKDYFVNVDVKKIWIKTKVSADDAGGLNLGDLKINPLVIGVGIGTKF